MSAKIHFLITSERGKTRYVTIKKRRILALTCASIALLLISAVGWRASVENITLRAQGAAIKYELATVKEKHRMMLARAANQEEEQRVLLDTAMDELRQRSEVIESILNTVGIELDTGDSRSNIGGPYIGLADDSYGDLTFKVDHYLDFIQSVPLGTPVPGTLTSPFGRRTDPFHGRPALHDGLDIHNRVGTTINSPAAGRVITSDYTRGNGNYVEIDHGNGFKTRYLHLQRTLVKAGEQIERGQEIGRLGNTGRSTGPHLHYTILHKNKAIDPYRFVRVTALLNGSIAARGSIRGQEVQ